MTEEAAIDLFMTATGTMPQPQSTSIVTWPPALAAALILAQREARAVFKDGRNKQQDYAYAKSEDLFDEGRAALNKADLALAILGVDWANPAASGDGVVGPPIAKFHVLLVHGSGESVGYSRDWPVIAHKGKPEDKSLGGALTSALGYAIRDLLLIPRDNDLAAMDRRDDGDKDEAAPPRAPAPTIQATAESPRSSASAPRAVDSFESLLAEIQTGRAGDNFGEVLRAARLTREEEMALGFVLSAHDAADAGAFSRVGADIRQSDLSKDWITFTLAAVRPAWDALQARLAKAGTP